MKMMLDTSCAIYPDWITAPNTIRDGSEAVYYPLSYMIDRWFSSPEWKSLNRISASLYSLL